MYQSYFGLRDHPFTITPDPGYLYLSAHHQEALAHLIYGTKEQGGFVQLTGEVGTGKTTLIRSLLAQQLDNVDVALCLNPRLTEWDLLASVCDELGVNYPRKSQSLKPVLDALNQHLLKSHGQSRQTVLIIDEAQQLGQDVLEQVRLLTNLETHSHKLLRIILVGQPELQQLLARPELRQLAQRITARYHLLPLNRAETAEYVNHRLKVAGNRAALFTQGALKAVYRWSQGVPRVINIICDRALLAAYVNNQSVVSRRLLNQAAAEVLYGPEEQQVKRSYWGRLTFATTTGALLAIALALNPDELDPARLEQATIDQLTVIKPPEDQEPIDQLTAIGPSSAPDVGPLTDEVTTTVAKLEGDSVADYKRYLFEVALKTESLDTKHDVESEEDQVEVSLPEISEISLGQHLSAIETGEENGELLQHFLQLWRVALPGLIAKPGAFCDSDMLIEVELACFSGQANLDEMRAFNRPAIVGLLDEAGLRHELLLTAIGETTLTLELKEYSVIVEHDEFESYWTGEYVLLWRSPVTESLLGLGSQGDGVIWLRNRLALVDFIVGSDNAVFDNSLQERVKQFQRSRGLQVDGLVGSRTLLLLDNLAIAPGTPVLQILPTALTETGD